MLVKGEVQTAEKIAHKSVHFFFGALPQMNRSFISSSSESTRPHRRWRKRGQRRCKQLKNSLQICALFLLRFRFIRERKTSRKAAKEMKGGKMNPRMPKGEAPKLYLGVHACLVFPDSRNEEAVLDLMRRFSSAARFAYNRLLEAQGSPG
jgi:hypothetical protein